MRQPTQRRPGPITGEPQGSPSSSATGAEAKPTGRARAGGRTNWRPILLAIAVYIVIGMVGNYPAWLHGPGHMLQCGGCGDNGQQVWFLAWATHALIHLQDPLRTNWVHYPWGADMANDTSMPLAGILGTPITLLFGPVATYNVMITAAFASSATAAMFASRRWTSSSAAAFVGGLLYGFSPFMVGQGLGHLFMLLSFIPPLLLIVLHEILFRRSWPWIRSGAVLALLLVVQLGFSEELLALEALVALLGLVVLTIARPPGLRLVSPYARRALALGLGGALPFVLAMVIIGQTGPEHAIGPAHPVRVLAGLSSDLLSPVVPTVNQHFSLGFSTYGTKLVSYSPIGKSPIPDAAENGAYIGVPLLLLLCLGGWRLRRQGMVRFAALMAALCLLLSMGARLHVGASGTPVRLPFSLLTGLPLVQSEVASRYTLLMWLFLSVLTAIVIDRLIFARAARAESGGRMGVSVQRWLAVVLLGLGLLALVPQWPYGVIPAQVAPWFSSADEQRVPVGSTLLTYPEGNNAHNLPMLWQAINGLRYRTPGGEMAVPYEHYSPVQAAFDMCWLHPNLKTAPAALVPAVRVTLLSWQVRTLVVPFQYTINPSCAVRFLSVAMGSLPRWEHEAAVWRPTTATLVRLVSAPG